VLSHDIDRYVVATHSRPRALDFQRARRVQQKARARQVAAVALDAVEDLDGFGTGGQAEPADVPPPTGQVIEAVMSTLEHHPAPCGRLTGDDAGARPPSAPKGVEKLAPAAQGVVGEQGEEALGLVKQDAEVRVKWTCQRGRLANQSRIGLVL
jgi:hypothetical protein